MPLLFFLSLVFLPSRPWINGNNFYFPLNYNLPHQSATVSFIPWNGNQNFFPSDSSMYHWKHTHMKKWPWGARGDEGVTKYDKNEPFSFLSFLSIFATSLFLPLIHSSPFLAPPEKSCVYHIYLSRKGVLYVSFVFGLEMWFVSFCVAESEL